MGKFRVRKHDLRCRNQAKSKAFLEKMNFISKGKKKNPRGGGGLPYESDGDARRKF